MTAAQQVRAVTVVLALPGPAQRRRARAAVEAEHDLLVVGEARTGEQAVDLVRRLRPDVLLLDLAAATGLSVVEQVMASRPTPILAFADDPGLASAALAAGAVDVLRAPAYDGSGDADALRRALRLCARVRVITHPRARLRPPARPAPARRLVVLGASTGGPHALREVLRALPADLEQAVLVVQHMSEGFLPGLVEWLDAALPLPVVLGTDGVALAPGVVTVAPSGGNFVVRDRPLRAELVAPAAGQFHVPGIDATLTSAALVLGAGAVGVLLTGMGRDGAAGLRCLREAGGLTLAQDQATSTVYGMPAAAVALDAVDRQLPLTAIGGAVLAAVGR